MTHEEIVRAYRDAAIDARLDASREPYCAYYSTALREASAEAEGRSDGELAELLRLLGAIAGGRVNRADPTLSYDPFYISEQRRPVPQQLADDEVAALRTVAEVTTNIVLKARLLDVLWHARRDLAACQRAVTAYLDAAEIARGSFTHRVEHVARGVGLARGLGWRHQTFVASKARLLALTRSVDANEPRGFFACQMFEIVCDYVSAEEARPFIDSALHRANTARAASDFHAAEQYFLVAAKLQQKVGDNAAVSATNVLLGESLVERAEQFANQAQPSFMGAVHWMARGIEQLQRQHVPRERLTQLRARLAEMQQRSLGEMAVIQLPADLVAAMDAEQRHNRELVRQAVTGRRFPEALLRLAQGLPLCSLAEIRTSLDRMARQAPLQALMARNQLDDRGRTEAVIGGAIGAEQEAAMQARAYAHALQWIWPARADLIAHAVNTIYEEHTPRREDLFFVANSSPWVVQDHEEIVVRGLLAGLYHEWMTSAHLLVPQFEASIRSVMERQGVIVANLEDGVEQDRTLGALLDLPECGALLGGGLVFELRGLLLEKTGFNFRNTLAHGLLTDRECYSVPAVLSWWLMLRLCCVPVPAAPAAGG